MAEAKDEAGGRAHLEEAAELLRKCERANRDGRFENGDDPDGLLSSVFAWYDRDQALSAPTAESGEDESICGKRTIPLSAATHQCELPENHDGECVWTDMRRDAEPAPVAEATERVTIEQARDALHRTWTAGDDCKRVLRRYLDQQEQSEREVAELRERVDEEEGRAAVWMEIAAQRTRQLTASEQNAARWESLHDNRYRDLQACQEMLADANLKAEGLRVELEQSEELRKAGSKAFVEQRDELSNLRREVEGENGLRASKEAGWALAKARLADIDALRAKLAESERKLGELHERLTWLCDMWRDLPRDSDRARTFGEAAASVRHILLTPGASTEPAEVEAGKVERVAPELLERATIHDSPHRNKVVPAPTETEAPARFRVGQPVRELVERGEIGHVLGYNSAHDGLWSVEFPDGTRRYRPEQLEPADPAPPKPGGDALANIELFLSGAEKDWLEGKQTDALWSVICAMREIYPKLEREGDGKS